MTNEKDLKRARLLSILFFGILLTLGAHAVTTQDLFTSITAGIGVAIFLISFTWTNNKIQDLRH